MSAFKPKQKTMAPRDPEGGSSADFVTPEPEEGLRGVAVSLLVSLGTQVRTPYQKKDDQGNELVDDDGQPVMISPKPNEQVALYVDLLDDEHDYGEEIGVKQIRQPLHSEFGGRIDDGLNFKEVGQYTPQGDYLKGRPWTLPPAGLFAKIAKACGAPEIMVAGDYKDNRNEHKSDISRLLGKPFLMNVEIARKDTQNAEGKDVTYVNVKLKTPVPVMKGMVLPELTTEPVALGFMSEVDELVEQGQFFRPAVRKKIMAALDYHNINYDDENAPVEPSNMKLAFEQLNINEWGRPEKASEEGASAAPKKAVKAVKTKPKAKSAPKAKPAPVKAEKPSEDDFEDDCPF